MVVKSIKRNLQFLTSGSVLVLLSGFFLNGIYTDLFILPNFTPEERNFLGFLGFFTPIIFGIGIGLVVFGIATFLVKKKFVFLVIILVFLFVMFVPLIPTGLIILRCEVSGCNRGIISLYEMILNWENYLEWVRQLPDSEKAQ